MQQKPTRKEKPTRHQQSGAGPQGKQDSRIKSNYTKLKRSLGILTAVLAFLFYANTLNHEYVLDDFGLIRDNTITKKGFQGIPEIFYSSYRSGMNQADNQVYRPLSKVLFAIEWQIAPDKPAFGHWINVFLFALSCFLLFRVLTFYFEGNLLVPFLTAILFAAHPIHTEVVANIKSADEILCFLFCLLTALWSYKYMSGQKFRHLAFASLSFFLALLSKESALTWIAVIPLFLYFFTKAKSSQYFAIGGSLLITAIIFLLIRNRVLGDHVSLNPIDDNYLAGIKDALTQKTTAIFLLGVYLKLLIIPHPLISDGSFSHFPVVGPGDWKFLIAFLIYVALTVFAIMRFRKKDFLSFGILYFLVTLTIVSNLLVLIGTNYGERLLYIPSLGFCLCVALMLEKYFADPEREKKNLTLEQFFRSVRKPVTITAVIVLVFAVRTIARNNDWHDELKLFSNDVKSAPNSAHLRYYLANVLVSEDRLETLPDSSARNEQILQGIAELNKCLEIDPKYPASYQRRGYMYFMMNNYSKAGADYAKALDMDSENAITHNNYGMLLFNQGKYTEARSHLEKSLQLLPGYGDALTNLGSVYGMLGQSEFEKAIVDSTQSAKHIQQGRDFLETSIKYFEDAIKAEPDYSEPYRMLMEIYRMIGDVENTDKYAGLMEQVLHKQGKKKHE